MCRPHLDYTRLPGCELTSPTRSVITQTAQQDSPAQPLLFSSVQIQMTMPHFKSWFMLYVRSYLCGQQVLQQVLPPPPPLCLQGAYSRVINELEQGPTVPPRGSNPGVALDIAHTWRSSLWIKSAVQMICRKIHFFEFPRSDRSLQKY